MFKTWAKDNELVFFTGVQGADALAEGPIHLPRTAVRLPLLGLWFPVGSGSWPGVATDCTPREKGNGLARHRKEAKRQNRGLKPAAIRSCLTGCSWWPGWAGGCCCPSINGCVMTGWREIIWTGTGITPGRLELAPSCGRGAHGWPIRAVVLP